MKRRRRFALQGFRQPYQCFIHLRFLNIRLLLSAFFDPVMAYDFMNLHPILQAFSRYVSPS